MKRKSTARTIVRSEDELPPGYVRLSSWLDDGRKTEHYNALYAATQAGRLTAAKLHLNGRENHRGPVYVNRADALAYLEAHLPRRQPATAPLFPVDEATPPRALEPVATVAASLAAGDPGTVDRLAASLERVAEALEEILRRGRVELDLEPCT